MSSREAGLKGRAETVTMSSLEDEKTKKKQNKKDGIRISFKSKDRKNIFFTGSKEDKTNEENRKAEAKSKSKKMHGIEKAEAKHTDVTDTWTTDAGCSGSSSKVSPQTQSEEKLEKTKFIVLQKNMRSMNSSERIEELFSELHQVTWDVILISETWRQGKDIWETQQGHIMVESGKFINKHGVAILLNRRWTNQINWVQCAYERVVALSISVNKQPITLVSV